MAASFVSEGVMALVPALAVMLGANVGTTLIVQVLSFNISAAAPVLFVVGLVAFRSGGRSRLKDTGRIAIGLGLMLLALHILLDTLAPAENAPERARAPQTDHRRPDSLCVDRRRPDLGCTFERRNGAADHVPGIFAIHYAGRGARAGARGEPRQRNQSGARGRPPRGPIELSASGWKPPQQVSRV